MCFRQQQNSSSIQHGPKKVKKLHKKTFPWKMFILKAIINLNDRTDAIVFLSIKQQCDGKICSFPFFSFSLLIQHCTPQNKFYSDKSQRYSSS